jgi:hypothetical protein
MAVMIKARTRNKKYLEIHKAKNPCKSCGERRSVLLTYHHRDPKTKKYNVGSLVSNGRSIDLLKKEIAKCDVLCHNCHVLEHSKTVLEPVTKILSFCGVTLMYRGTKRTLVRH